jgi:hypothetical protein
MNFCPLALSAPKARLGWERFRNSRLSGKAKQKNFVSLIEKSFGHARLKKCRENFSVLLRLKAERKRWAGSAFSMRRLSLEKSSSFVQNFRL